METDLKVDQRSGFLLSLTPKRKVTDEVVSLLESNKNKNKLKFNLLTFKVFYPLAQCAAVTTHCELIKLPPQTKPPFESIRTCQPQSPAVAGVPPTILVDETKGLSPQLDGFKFFMSVELTVDWSVIGIPVAVVEEILEMHLNKYFVLFNDWSILFGTDL